MQTHPNQPVPITIPDCSLPQSTHQHLLGQHIQVRVGAHGFWARKGGGQRTGGTPSGDTFMPATHTGSHSSCARRGKAERWGGWVGGGGVDKGGQNARGGSLTSLAMTLPLP